MKRRRMLASAVLAMTVTLLATTGALASSRADTGSRQPGAIYYASEGAHTILRYSFGTHRTTTIATMATQPDGMVRADRRLFWQQFTESTCAGRPGGGGEIMFTSLGAARPRPHVLVRCTYGPEGITVLHRYLYFASINGIGRVALNGTQLNRRFIPLTKQAEGDSLDGLAGDGTHVYFTRCDDAEIGRVDYNGSGLTYRFASTRRRDCPQEIAVGGGHVYWACLGIFGNNGGIGRVNLDGSHDQPRWQSIHTAEGPFQLAADKTHVYWVWGGAASTPTYIARIRSNHLSLTKRWRRGNGGLLLTTPGAGS